jgi:hypothetical protein
LFFLLPTVSQLQLVAVSNKKPKFGPKVATQAWWIEEIKRNPIYQYTEEWAKHSEYQVARWKILAELDYKVLGTSILRGAPGLGQTYPPKIQFKPSWFKPLIGADFKTFQLWTWLEATKSLGLPISEEADKWYKHISTEDLKEGAIKLLGIFKEETSPVLEDYSEYELVYPTTPLINSIVLDIPVGPYYKYLNKTIKDSSYFPTTESGLVIRKKFLEVYLEERLAEYLALGGLNELIQRVPLIEAGHKLPDPFFWDLWANLEHLRESYTEFCAQEHFNPEASEEESVASLDTQN